MEILEDEKTRSEVNRIVRRYENSVSDSRRRLEEQQQEMQKFHQEYGRVKKDVIKTSDGSSWKYIRESGHDYRVIESEKMITMDHLH